MSKMIKVSEERFVDLYFEANGGNVPATDKEWGYKAISKSQMMELLGLLDRNYPKESEK